jgi:hypothetical protein
MMLYGTHDVLEVFGYTSVRIVCTSSNPHTTGEHDKDMNEILMPSRNGARSGQPIAYVLHTLNKVDVCGGCSNQETILSGYHKPDSKSSRTEAFSGSKDLIRQ